MLSEISVTEEARYHTFSRVWNLKRKTPKVGETELKPIDRQRLVAVRGEGRGRGAKSGRTQKIHKIGTSRDSENRGKKEGTKTRVCLYQLPLFPGESCFSTRPSFCWVLSFCKSFCREVKECVECFPTTLGMILCDSLVYPLFSFRE